MSNYEPLAHYKFNIIKDLLGRINKKAPCTITFYANLTSGLIIYDQGKSKVRNYFTNLDQAIQNLKNICIKFQLPIKDPPPPPKFCSRRGCSGVFQPFYSEWLGRDSDLCEECESEVYRCEHCCCRPCCCGV